MRTITLLLILAFPALLNAQAYHIPEGLKKGEYVDGRLIIKVKPEYASLSENALQTHPIIQAALQNLGDASIKKVFPHVNRPGKKFNELNQKLVDLSAYFELQFPNNKSLYEVALLIEKTGLAEHVQPRFVSHPMATPNDPQIGQQYHHALIKTFEAWDIAPGDTNVLIGITDAGIQFDHEDLGNWQFNYADPENGMDDDNNGYIDDIAGWNTASNINDPTATLSPHGMFTTGMSSATVNNALGIAGNAGNCRYVPIRIDDASGFSYGYEGIIYAAERGCQIINASWGNTFYDPMAADVVNYATINKGALIIAASGNSGLNEVYYPASYPGVMSIGATGSSDNLWNQSTYGPWLDLVAPGELVYSTWPFNGYSESSGTSFSSPLVAGAAAIVKSHFPTYNGQQLAERLRVTADTALFELPENATFRTLMGAGRLNMLRAVSDPEIPAIRLVDHVFSDGNDEIFIVGDTLRLAGNLMNFLAPSVNLQVSITCSSPYIEVLESSYSAGAIATLSATSLPSTAFGIKILPGISYNEDILIRLRYSDPGYVGYEYVQVRVNRDYLDLTFNNLSTTVTSNGNFGYNADYATDGLGIRYETSQSLIYSSSFMLGTSAGLTADNAYAATLPGYDSDFVRSSGASQTTTTNSQLIESAFYTDSAATSRLEVRQKAVASNLVEDLNFIRYEFSISNLGNSAISGLHAGIFSDWDIEDATTNQGAYDAGRKLSYCYSPSGMYAGWMILSDEQAHTYLFNNDGSNGSALLYDGFSDSEKFNALSGAQTRNSASGEVSALLGTNGLSIGANDSIQIRFALVAGNSLAELQQAADRAVVEDRFAQLNLSISSQGESCNLNDGFIQLSADPVLGTSLILKNSQGVTLQETSDLSAILFDNLAGGAYTLEFVFAPFGSHEIDVQLASSQPVTIDANASSVVLVLPNANVDFTADAVNSNSYAWDFADGFFSEEQNPSHTYTQQGTFVVSCIATNGTCSDTAYIEILVGSTVSIIEAYQSNNTHLMPNPADHMVMVNSRIADELTSIKMYDMSGKLILDTRLPGSSGFIETKHLPEGIYMVYMETSKGIIADKLLVKHSN